jgi:hypothetical protein
MGESFKRETGIVRRDRLRGREGRERYERKRRGREGERYARGGVVVEN